MPPELSRALAAMDQLRSYRVNGLLTSAEGRLAFTLAYVAPDRRHIVFGELEIIEIGPDSYVKSGGVWAKVDRTGGGLVPSLDSVERQLEGATFAPPRDDTLDGEPVTVVAFTQREQRGTIWIAKRDGLIRKIEGTYAQGDFAMTIGDVNQPITIEPPI